MNELIAAKVIWDGGPNLSIPPQMGTPNNSQMFGTVAEQLGELAGRICYDSLGKGRPSFTEEVVTGVDRHTGEQLLKTVQGYHDHILETKNLSVHEHFNATIRIPFGIDVVDDNRKMLVAMHMLNRPGVFTGVGVNPAGIRSLRVTLNARCVLEWDAWSRSMYGYRDDQFMLDHQIEYILRLHFHEIAPHVVSTIEAPCDLWPELINAELDIPIHDEERWVSMYMSGSRGFSHELVRHGDRSAISQRSTRYVDESESDWVTHPLESAFIDQMPSDDARDWVEAGGLGVIGPSQIHYKYCVSSLEPWLISRGVDKATARKQSRGAARGYLGNALFTELVFSASVAQWKRMIQQRASPFADAEIRECFCKAIKELKESRYADCFEEYRLVDSPDGIGQIAVT